MTKKFLDPNIFWRISRNNIAPDLFSKVKYLINNQDDQIKLKKLTTEFANNNLKSWDSRIDSEINIINNILK